VIAYPITISFIIGKAYPSAYVRRAEFGKGNTYKDIGRSESGQEKGNCLPIPKDLLANQAYG